MSWNKEYNKEPICPYCGHINPFDTYELDAQATESSDNCSSCGKEYEIDIQYTLTYSTSKASWDRKHEES